MFIQQRSVTSLNTYSSKNFKFENVKSVLNF